MEQAKEIDCNLLVDFDSTFVKLEALEELAKFSLRHNPDKEQTLNQVKEITEKGMKGEIPFSVSLQRRLALFRPSKEDIKKTIEELEKNITDSVIKNRRFFETNANKIWIISGGFKELIWPIAEKFGIREHNILANEFSFDFDGNVIGIDKHNFLAQDMGKVKQTKFLKDSGQLKGKIVSIGDGWTDYEVKKAGFVDEFWVFCENIARENVIEVADKKIMNFDQVVSLLS